MIGSMELVELGEALFGRRMAMLDASAVERARFGWDQDAPSFSVGLTLYFLERFELDSGEVDAVRGLAARGAFGRTNAYVLELLEDLDKHHAA